MGSNWAEMRWIKRQEENLLGFKSRYNLQDPRHKQITEFNVEKGKIAVAIYNIRIESVFVLTQSQVKQALGHGYKVSAVEIEKSETPKPITDIDSAVEQIIKTGYRALARAYHPDIGGDANTMMILNKAKKEIQELLEAVR